MRAARRLAIGKQELLLGGGLLGDCAIKKCSDVLKVTLGRVVPTGKEQDV